MVKLLNADEAEFAELSTDSVEDTNLFSYCNNNPVMGTDPEGNLSNGWKIDTTPGHPFYVDGKGWYPAESLDLILRLK